MMTPLAHTVAQSSFFKDWLQFKLNSNNLKNVQRNALERILKRHPYIKSSKELFSSPIRNYSEQMAMLDKFNFKANRYQPTSGSGDKEKLIPYTSSFIRELNLGLNPWLFDLGMKYPSILTGKHYWSLSWLPTHYREKNWQLDDFELLPKWKKSLTSVMMSVPNEVSRAETLEASQFATLAYLIASKDLTFLSVWSPTFLIQLLAMIPKWKNELEHVILHGRWPIFTKELSFLKAPRAPDQFDKILEPQFLWPNLKLISSWDSSTSKPWADKLMKHFPHASFQGKGLWATEGVVTIPFENFYVLSYFSHFYEFLNLKSGDVLPSWELKEGMEVHPLITSGNGFTRYNLKDRLVVTGHYQKVPTLEFLERDQAFDMVGEKMDSHCFLEIHNEMKKHFPDLIWVDAFAVNSHRDRSYYHFVFQGSGDEQAIYQMLNLLLHQRFHYHLASELGQLAPMKLYISQDAFKKYEKFQIKRGMIQGNIKVELVTYIKTLNEEKIYYEHFPH